MILGTSALTVCSAQTGSLCSYLVSPLVGQAVEMDLHYGRELPRWVWQVRP